MSANHTAPNQRDKIIRKVSYSLSHIPRRRLEYPHASTNCDKPISSFSLIFCKGTTKIAHMQISSQKSFGNLHFFAFFCCTFYNVRFSGIPCRCPFSPLECLSSIAPAASRILLSFLISTFLLVKRIDNLGILVIGRRTIQTLDCIRTSERIRE